MNKQIRIFYRRTNYNSSTKRRVQCEKSLSHSLRLADGTKDLEWNPDLMEYNRIWLNGHIDNLNAFSADYLQTLLYQIAPPPAVRNKKQLQKRRQQYKLKIKKAVAAEWKNENRDAAEYMQRILDTPDTKFIPYQLKGFDELKMTRKSQRTKMLDNYLDAHNPLRSQVANANSVYIQEGIFKIPLGWDVGTDIISVDEYINHTSQFLTEYFPDYQIKAILGHDDERELNEKTGAHTHYFLSGRHSKTGNYDLHRKQIAVVNDYIKECGDAEDILPASCVLNRRESVLFGEYFQRLFYQFTNQHLLNPKGLIAVIATETERKSEQRRIMNREAKLPKIERSHNFTNRQLAINEEKCLVAQAKLETINAHYEIAVSNLKKMKHENASIKQQIEEGNQGLSQLQEKCETKIQEIETLKSEIRRVSSLLHELNSDVTALLSKIIRDIYVRTVARSKQIDSAANSYFKKIMINFEKVAPGPLRELCIDATASVDDRDLLDAMRKSQDPCRPH